MAAVHSRRARSLVLALSWLLGSRLLPAQAMSGIAPVDAASAARAAWSRAAAALETHDYAAAHREMEHAAAAWPTQPAYLWGRAVAGLLAADTAGVFDALNAYGALGLGRDLHADARFAGLVMQPRFAATDANRGCITSPAKRASAWRSRPRPSAPYALRASNTPAVSAARSPATARPQRYAGCVGQAAAACSISRCAAA